MQLKEPDVRSKAAEASPQLLLTAPRSNFWAGFLALSAVTAIYGFSYLVVDDTIDRLPVGVMNLGQFGLSALCFLPWLNRNPLSWRAGAELSVILTTYFSLQAFALLQSGVHESAFIQTLDTLFVPFFMSLGGQRPGFRLWLASGLAFSGVAIMSHQGGAISLSDVWSLLAAFCYALYLLRIDHWAKRVPSLTLTASQSVCGAMISLVWVLGLEPQWLMPAQVAQISWPNLLYLGILATGLTTFLHLWGQRRINATQAAVTLALEPVWASVFAWLLLRQSPGFQGLMGGGVILIATFLCVAATREPAQRAIANRVSTIPPSPTNHLNKRTK